MPSSRVWDVVGVTFGEYGDTASPGGSFLVSGFGISFTGSPGLIGAGTITGADEPHVLQPPQVVSQPQPQPWLNFAFHLAKRPGLSQQLEQVLPQVLHDPHVFQLLNRALCPQPQVSQGDAHGLGQHGAGAQVVQGGGAHGFTHGAGAQVVHGAGVQVVHGAGVQVVQGLHVLHDSQPQDDQARRRKQARLLAPAAASPACGTAAAGT